MDISINQLIEKAGMPVSLPDAFIRINDLSQQANSSVAEFAQVIETDIGLTARLLQIVNSPYYGFPSNINSIARAVTILGTHDLRDLALATTTIDLFSSLDNKQDHIRTLWRHSLYCAVLARALGQALKQHQSERFFVAGLLHDIGRLIFFQGIPETLHETIKQARSTGKDLIDIEFSILGYTHTDVGARLAEQWNLPANVAEAIEFHHHPDKAQQFPVDAAIVHIANHLANSIDQESSLVEVLPSISKTALGITQVDNNIIDKVVTNAPAQFAEIFELLFPREQAA